MADQIDIDELVRDLKELIPLLRNLGSTPTTKTGTDQGVERIINALGKLNATIKGQTTTRAEEQKAMKRFVADVDRATKAQQEQADQIEKDLKTQKELADTYEEALRLNKLTNEERKKQFDQDKKKSNFESAVSSVKQNTQKKETQSWAHVMDTYSQTATAGGVLKDRFESMGGTSLGATVGLKLMTGVVEGLTSGLFEYGKAVYKGEIGARGASKGLVTLTKTIGTVAQGLGSFLLLVPGAQLLGAGLIAAGTAAKTFANITEELAEVSDRLYNNYQDLSRVGVTAGDGMIGLAESAKKLGYGIDEGELGLKKFAALLTKSSQDLSMFAGSAMEGRKRLAEVGDGFARGPFGQSLQNMGMSIDTINEGLVGYITLQSRSGAIQKKSTEELRAGAAKYLVEMDGLTKLTGIQRQELEQSMLKAQAVQQFRSKIDEMKNSGDKELIARAAELEKTYAVLDKQAPGVAQGFAEAVTGIYSSKEGVQFFQTIEQGSGVIEKLSNQGIKAEEALGLIYGQAKLTTDQFRSLAAAGAFNDVFGNYGQLSDLAARAGLSTEEAMKIIEDSQAQQKKGAEGATGAATKLRAETLDARDALQDLTKLGVKPATKALGGLTGVINDLLGIKGKGDTGSPPTVAKAASPDIVNAGKTIWSGAKKLFGSGDTTSTPASTPAPAAKAAPATGTTAAPPAPGSREAAIEQMRRQTAPLSKSSNATSALGGTGTQPSLLDKIIHVESGGRNIGTTGSSAFGIAQFTKGTFEDLAKKAQPGNPLYGKTWEDYKSDVGLQREALAQLTESNKQILANKGLPTTDSAAYLAHFLGAGGASKILSMPDSTPISNAVSADAIKSNPSVFNNVATVGDLKTWADKKMGGTGYATSAALGGIFAGPKSGYPAILHGTEAVIPIGADRKMPMDVDGMMNSMDRVFAPQMQAMQAQLTRLDELVSLMRRQASTGERMLQLKQA